VQTLRITPDGLVEGVRYVASPNCDDRPAGIAIELAVIIEELFLNRLDPAEHPYFATIADLKVSAHFLVRRGGELLQFVPCSKRAWHAGISSWRGRSRCNDFSIGIELEGCDDLPFEAPQYEALGRLTNALQASYPIVDVAGHSDVAPGRKSDPGPFFDWPKFLALIGRRG
jgi:N-acetyl-anhydromuramoyl-L-alanine amidase